MKVSPLLVGLLMVAAAAAQAETVVVTQPWTKVRQQPRATAKPIDIVYGNDRFEMIAEEGGWYRIKTFRNREGWVIGKDVSVDGKAAPQAQPSTPAEPKPAATSAPEPAPEAPKAPPAAPPPPGSGADVGKEGGLPPLPSSGGSRAF